MKKLLTVAEAAEALNLRIPTVRAWLLRRRLPRVNCGRAVRIPADAIERFIERNTVPAKEEGLEAPVPIRVPEIHRAPGEFDGLPDELPDPSVGWVGNPERSRG
jgi:excisionase family DNA binding protein